MAHKTNIAWTNYASNPIRARRKSDGKAGWWCTRVSTGCEHCYSEVLNRRWGNQIDYKAQNSDQIEFYLDEKELASWYKIPAGAMCFVCDMTDLFHEQIPDWMIEQVFTAMGHAYRVTFQILTKRPQRMLEIVPNLAIAGKKELSLAIKPLPNVWLGVSVENQKAANERIPLLLRTPAAIRFLSCEPLLGPIELDGEEPESLHALGCGYEGGWRHPGHTEQCTGVDWVIVGGESGSNFRQMDLEWARYIQYQCSAAGAAFFYKQGASRFPGRETLLDGKEYHEWPEVKP